VILSAFYQSDFVLFPLYEDLAIFCAILQKNGSFEMAGVTMVFWGRAICTGILLSLIAIPVHDTHAASYGTA
jgi:hypothetical protein